MDDNKKADLYWAGLVVFGFAGVISFFQINGYQADKHNLNGFFLIAGIILILLALFCLWRLMKFTNTGGD